MSTDFLINRDNFKDEILFINRSNNPYDVLKVSAKTDSSFLKYLVYKAPRFSTLSQFKGIFWKSGIAEKDHSFWLKLSEHPKDQSTYL